MFQQQPQNSLFGGGGFSQSQPQFPSGGQSSFMGQPSGGFYGPTGANNFTFNYQNQPQLPAGTQQAMQGRMQEMRGAMQQPSLDMNAVAADPAAFQSFLQQLPAARASGAYNGWADQGLAQMGYAQPNAVRYGSNIAGSGPMAGGLAGAYLQQGIAPALDEMQSMYGQAGQNIGDSIAALAPVTATPVAPAPAPTPMVSSPAPVAPVPAPVAPAPAPQSAYELFRSLNAPNARQQARAATRAARQETRAAKKAANPRQPAPALVAPAPAPQSAYELFRSLNAPNTRQQARAATKAAQKEARAVKKAAKSRR
jgi:hypothetical protein